VTGIIKVACVCSSVPAAGDDGGKRGCFPFLGNGREAGLFTGRGLRCCQEPPGKLFDSEIRHGGTAASGWTSSDTRPRDTCKSRRIFEIGQQQPHRPSSLCLASQPRAITDHVVMCRDPFRNPLLAGRVFIPLVQLSICIESALLAQQSCYIRPDVLLRMCRWLPTNSPTVWVCSLRLLAQLRVYQ
jgi:hypothetical protein